jgi:hypothetical protein
MDRRLHTERRAPPLTRRLRDLPDGSIFAAAGQFWLKTGDETLAWDFGGYRPAETPFDPDEMVDAITAPAILAVLSAGYRPRLHPSALVRS